MCGKSALDWQQFKARSDLLYITFLTVFPPTFNTQSYARKHTPLAFEGTWAAKEMPVPRASDGVPAKVALFGSWARFTCG